MHQALVRMSLHALHIFLKKNLIVANDCSVTIGIHAMLLFLNGQVVRASASGVVDWGLVPSRAKPIVLKLVFTALWLIFSIKGTVWRTSR